MIKYLVSGFIGYTKSIKLKYNEKLMYRFAVKKNFTQGPKEGTVASDCFLALRPIVYTYLK
jgi:hypothetical protein